MEDKRFEISALLDLYGSLLSERRRDVLELYYNADLSLAEIAQETGITRQGARDAIEKGKRALFFYEEGLGFAEKTRRVKALAAEIKEAAVKSGCKTVLALAEQLAEL